MLTEQHIKLLKIIYELSDGNKEAFFDVHGTYVDRSLNGLAKFGFSPQEAHSIHTELLNDGLLEGDMHTKHCNFIWVTKKGEEAIGILPEGSTEVDITGPPLSYPPAGEVKTESAMVDGVKSRRPKARKVVYNKSSDFFDNLRALDEAMKFLSREIRSINNPERITPELKAVKAYVDAFRAFLDVEPNEPPEVVPAAVSKGLLVRLRKIDWLSVSNSAQKWVDTIVRIVTRFF